MINPFSPKIKYSSRPLASSDPSAVRAPGAIWSNFEWTVCEIALGSVDGRGRDPCVLSKPRAWVCGAFSASAAVWSTVARKMT